MGAKLLVLSAFPTSRQEGLGWPHPGIYFGIDMTTNFSGRSGPEKSYPRPISLKNPAVDEHGNPDPSHANWQGEADALWRTVERGTNVWESLTNLSASAEGFDIDFVPVDADHPPQTNQTHLGIANWFDLDWEPGFYVQMNTWVKQGNDRTRDNTEDHSTTVEGVEHGYGSRNVIFQCGIGRDNLDNFIFRPDASAMRNYVGVHKPGGEKNRGDKASMVHAWVQELAVRYGQYHEWKSSGQDDPKSVMKEIVNHWLAAYGFPPTFFDIELSPDRHAGGVEAEQPFRYGYDFWVGDYITAEVKEGQMHFNLDGRITKVIVSQEGDTKRAKTTLECVPRVLDNLDEITESSE